MRWFRMINWLMFALVWSVGTAQAQTFHMRLLMHGHKQIHESGIGIAGWVIATSVTDTPDQWLALVGPRYDGADYKVELMGGTIIKSGKATPLVDVRLEFTRDLFDIPLYAWANAEWIASGGAGTFYGYLLADYILPNGLALVGLETENLINNSMTDLSIGPHLIVPMGKLALIGAYQFHTNGGDQFWTRLVFNL